MTIADAVDFDTIVLSAMTPGVPYKTSQIRFALGCRWHSRAISRSVWRMVKRGEILMRDGKAVRPCTN